MSYIGQRPVVGRYIKLDQISSGFNGSNTGFSMTAGSQAVFPGTARNLLLSLGGVIQEPDTDFTISGSTLTFTTPPLANTTFFGVIYGDMQATGTPSDGTVLPASIASSGHFKIPQLTVNEDGADVDFRVEGDTDANLLFVDASADKVGIGTSSPSQLLHLKQTGANALLLVERDSGGIGFLEAQASKFVLGSSNNNAVHIVQNSGDALTIDTSKNVGIGTVSPAFKLDVVGAIHSSAAITGQDFRSDAGTTFFLTTGSDYRFRHTGGTERMRLDSSGRLLIGTASARSSGGGVSAHLQLEGTTSQGAELLITRNTADTYSPTLGLVKTRGTSVGSNTSVVDNDVLGKIQFRGADGSDIFAVGASIFARVNGTPSDGTDMPAELVFATTADGAASPTERMFIDSSGNVGIGTASPITKLDVNGDVRATNNMYVGDSIFHIADTNTRIRFPADDTFTIETAGSERLRVDSGGSIGIGTTSPNVLGNDNMHTILSIIETSGTRRGQIELGDNQNVDGGGIGDIHFVGHYQDSGHRDMACVKANASGSTSGKRGAYLSFETKTDNVAAIAERMRIDSAGRVQIGSTNNSATGTKLVVGSGNNMAATALINTQDTDINALTLSNWDGATTSHKVLIGFDNSGRGSFSLGMPAATNALAFFGSIDGSSNERMRINSDGNVLINTTAIPTGYGNLNVFGTDNIGSRVSIRRGSANNDGPSIWFNKSRNTTDGSHTVVQANDNLGSIIFTGNDSQGPEYAARIMCEVDGTPGSNDMPGRLVFSVTPDGSDSISEAMRIHNSGKVAINTTNASGQLTVNGTSNAGHYVPGASGGIAQSGIHVGGNHGNSGERGGAISFSAGGAAACAIACRNESTDRDQIGLEFFTHNATDQAAAADRRLRMSTSGHMFFGNQDVLDNANNNSVGLSLSDHLGFFSVCRDSDIPLVVGITGSDTQLIRFIAQGSIEGNISVSGSTVSYNGGHLSRWSQIKGLSTTDKSARPTIYQGTVMSNLDDLCVWSYPDQFYTEQDKTNGFIPGDKEVGDLRKAAHTEENQQLNMTKVSDTEGDKDVAGVFWTWDNTNDDYYVNDYYIAMTGDMVIRVAASTTVARGDLLISAGDGTAKPQADDIIRSSTIAKITSTNATATYDDGSKAYPCVLMAC